MTQNIDLKQLERKMYKSASFQDGLIDIFMGFVLLANSFGPLFNSIGIPVPWNFFILSAPAWLIFLYVKKYITTPRLGVVKFGSKRKSRRKKLIIANIFAVIITTGCVILTLTSNLSVSINKYVDIILIGLISFVIPIGIIAYFLEFYRMFIFGILILFAWILKAFINKRIEPPFDWIITFGSVGIIFMVVGLVLLIRFLKKYPAQLNEISISGEKNGE